MRKVVVCTKGYENLSGCQQPSHNNHLKRDYEVARSPDYQRDGVTLYLGDCLEILPEISAVDAVVTDPPYGMGDKLGPRKRSDPNQWAMHFNSGAPEWDKEPPSPEAMQLVVSAADYAIIWGGQFFGLPPARCWLSWNKIVRNWSSSEHELAWTNLDKPNRAFDYSHGQLATEGKHFHPTQKPLPLMLWCIEHLPKSCKLICDPFMGSGTTGVACINAGCSFIGVEREQKYFDIAVKRIDAALNTDRDSLWTAKALAKETQPGLFE